jgi:hypothetical protein
MVRKSYGSSTMNGAAIWKMQRTTLAGQSIKPVPAGKVQARERRNRCDVPQLVQDNRLIMSLCRFDCPECQEKLLNLGPHGKRLRALDLSRLPHPSHWTKGHQRSRQGTGYS